MDNDGIYLLSYAAAFLGFPCERVREPHAARCFFGLVSFSDIVYASGGWSSFKTYNGF